MRRQLKGRRLQTYPGPVALWPFCGSNIDVDVLVLQTALYGDLTKEAEERGDGGARELPEARHVRRQSGLGVRPRAGRRHM